MEELERDADVAAKLEACLAENDDPARVQAMLEQTISPESQDAVSAILLAVSRLSVAEKLLLYLRLPSPRPHSAPQVDRCSRGEMQRSVAWVRTHLAPHPAVSLPKQHVYREYTAYAARQGVKPVSSADFGKAVKAAFPSVRPRRLGVRGQSRYCYAGVGKATTLPVPTLPGEVDFERKRLCKRPSTDVREFVDFSTVAPPPAPAPAATQSRPGSVPSRSASLESAPGPTPVPTPGSRKSTNQKPRGTGRRTQPSQRFVPIGPQESSQQGEGGAVSALEDLLSGAAGGGASPDLDAELLQYFAAPGPSVAAAAASDDSLWRLRRVLERSLDAPAPAPPPASDATWGAAPGPGGRGYLTAPPSPAPASLGGRGYVTAPSSPVPGSWSWRGQGAVLASAPPSPCPAAPIGRGYATAPPSPGAWPVGAWPAWRSQSVPVEPGPTPVPQAFRDFEPAPTNADGFFGGWGDGAAFPVTQDDLGQAFGLPGQPSDMDSSGLALGLDLDAAALDMGLDMNGQVVVPMEPLQFGLDGPMAFGGMGDGSMGPLQDQHMAMDVVSYQLSRGDMMPSTSDLPGRRVHCGRRQ